MKKRICILNLFLPLSIAVYGQFQPKMPISMPSANASNMAIYGETPVSKFTGVPSIDFPVYKISDGALSVSLELSYHAGGVKPDLHPGWVGLGWTLRSGGVITRKVNGLEDELETDLGGYYDNHTNLSGTDWSSFAHLKQIADTKTDSSPDEFSFNIEDISGKFLMDHTGTWQVQCDQDVKVIFNATDFTAPFMTTPPPNPYGLNSYHRNFGKFTLITGDGTQYIFGGINNAIDYSIDFFSQNSTQWTATSWYLTQIIAADGVHQIQFNYERDQYTNVLYFNRYYNTYSIKGANFSCQNNENLRAGALLSGNLIAPVYLKSIETSSELLQFDRSNSVELRYNLNIYNDTYQSYSKLRLNEDATSMEKYETILERQTYRDTTVYKFLPLLRQNSITGFPGILSNLQWKKLDRIRLTDKYTNEVVRQYDFTYTNDATKRLMLKSFKESNPSGSANDTMPATQFYYDESKPLAGYLSNSIDEWGYNSAKLYTDIRSFRSVDPEAILAGTLRKITYPTGGYKIFFFEPNAYSAIASGAQLNPLDYENNRGGGLRIKSIFDYDPVSQSSKNKKYYYFKNFTSPNQVEQVSSGIISALPSHNLSINNHLLVSGDTLNLYLSSRNTVMPLGENSGGSQIGYLEVAEVDADGGYTVEKFTNYDDGHADEGTLNTMFPEKAVLNGYTWLGSERGKVRYNAVYDKLGNRLKSTSIAYAPLRNVKTFVRASDVRNYKVCNYGTGTTLIGPDIYEGNAYKIYTYAYLPVGTVDSIFSAGSAPVVSVSSIFYDNPANRLATRLEQNRTDGQKLTDLTLFAQDYAVGTSFIDQMLQQNLSALPIEKVTYLTDLNTGAVKILSGTLTTYKTTAPYLKEEDFVLEQADPINLVDYKFSASAKGALPFNAAKLMFQKDALYQSQASYAYDTYGNLKQIQVTNGVPTAIQWGYLNRLPVMQVNNANANEVFYNGFEEETTNFSLDSKIGYRSKLLNGNALNLPVFGSLPAGRRYVLSYWYKNTGGTWTFFSNTYTALPASISGYTLVDELMVYPEGAKAKTMGYLSARGMPTYISDAGKSISYTYDQLSRLKTVSDGSQNMIKSFRYSYAPSQSTVGNFFYNTLQKGVFQRNDCSNGRTTLPYTYTVSPGSYISTVSQQDADSQAQNEIASKGQGYVNTTLRCLYYNAVQTGMFYSSDCPSPRQPLPNTVTIAAGTYSSDVSQADADAQAQTALAEKGALVNGSCYMPIATITVNNFLNENVPHKEFTITLTNLSTNTQYTSGVVNEKTSKSFNVPPGTYSITYATYGYYNSLQLFKNGQLVDCKGNNGSSWSNVTLVHSDSFQFFMGSSACPVPN